MTAVEVSDEEPGVNVQAESQTVEVSVDDPGQISAVEVPPPASGGVELEAQPDVVQVQVPVGTSATVVTTEVATVAEVDVAVPGTAVLSDDTPAVVEVEVPGEQGAKGDKGDKGDRGNPGPVGAGAAYVHYQNLPASVWNIQHLLGFFPAVTVQDSAGTSVEGDVVYVDIDNIQITFTASFGGVAYLS